MEIPPREPGLRHRDSREYQQDKPPVEEQVKLFTEVVAETGREHFSFREVNQRKNKKKELEFTQLLVTLRPETFGIEERERVHQPFWSHVESLPTAYDNGGLMTLVNEMESIYLDRKKVRRRVMKLWRDGAFSPEFTSYEESTQEKSAKPPTEWLESFVTELIEEARSHGQNFAFKLGREAMRGHIPDFRGLFKVHINPAEGQKLDVWKAIVKLIVDDPALQREVSEFKVSLSSTGEDTGYMVVYLKQPDVATEAEYLDAVCDITKRFAKGLESLDRFARPLEQTPRYSYPVTPLVSLIQAGGNKKAELDSWQNLNFDKPVDKPGYVPVNPSETWLTERGSLLTEFFDVSTNCAFLKLDSDGLKSRLQSTRSPEVESLDLKWLTRKKIQ